MTSNHVLLGLDVETERARVVILEPVELVATGSAHLVGSNLAGDFRARSGSNSDGAATSERPSAKVRDSGGGVGVRSRLTSGAGELGECDVSGTRGRVVGGLELAAEGQGEDEGASHAGIGGGDVEVEDCADGGADVAEVLGARGGGWGGAVNWDDQVGVLPAAGEFHWAGGGGGSRGGGTAGRRRGRRDRGGGGGRGS